MVASVTGSVAVALIGVVVGAVLGFAGSWLDTHLRAQRRGRTAGRLIWLELMGSRAAVRHMRETGFRWHFEMPLPGAVWDAERGAFAEVADAQALALVALAYQELAWVIPILAAQSERAVSMDMPATDWVEAVEPVLKGVFDSVEAALVQLDRYSGLAKGTVDYSELT